MVHKWRLAIYFPSQLDFPKVRPKEKLISAMIEKGDIINMIIMVELDGESSNTLFDIFEDWDSNFYTPEFNLDELNLEIIPELEEPQP